LKSATVDDQRLRRRNWHGFCGVEDRETFQRFSSCKNRASSGATGDPAPGSGERFSKVSGFG
jgi:hypothetical protein